MRSCLVLLGMLLGLSAQAGGEPRSLYDGASVQFEQAWFVKPTESTNLGGAYRLAPLLIQETHDSNTPALPGIIYYRPGAIRLNGVRHAQMTYWWRRPADSEDRQAARPTSPPVQHSPNATAAEPQIVSEAGSLHGVRLTLDEHEFPIVYELLQGDGGITQIYVAQSVEEAARAVHGPALPGRRHAIEPSLDLAPDVVVPRVIDDAPDSMGPILYLWSHNGAVATLICRCMEAQAHSLVGTRYYQLIKGIPPPEITHPRRPLAKCLRWAPSGK